MIEQARQAGPLLLPKVTGGLISESSYRAAWKSYENYLNIQAGGRMSTGRYVKAIQVIDHLTPHMFRHTYASLLYDADVDIKTAQRYLGHADSQTTLEVYVHLSKYKEGAAREKINRYLIDLHHDQETTEQLDQYIQAVYQSLHRSPHPEPRAKDPQRMER